MVSLIWGVCYAVISVFVLIEAVSRMRTYLQAKKYGILKAHVPTNALVITLCIVGILFIALLALIVEGEKAKQELLALGIQYSSYSELYSNPDIQGKYLLEAAKKVRQSVYLPPAILISIAYYVLVVLKRTLYITEAGLFARKLDAPVEISALRRGNKIDIYLKADTAHFKTLFSLDSTSKNLATLGRFIEWDD